MFFQGKEPNTIWNIERYSKLTLMVVFLPARANFCWFMHISSLPWQTTQWYKQTKRIPLISWDYSWVKQTFLFVFLTIDVLYTDKKSLSFLGPSFVAEWLFGLRTRGIINWYNTDACKWERRWWFGPRIITFQTRMSTQHIYYEDCRQKAGALINDLTISWSTLRR